MIDSEGVMIMDLDALRRKWQEEEELAFEGWNFSHLGKRWECAGLGWDYQKIVLDHIKVTDKLLDMGTGGGEFLLTLNHPYKLTSVTESYPPNVELCKRNLSPLGIEVRKIDDDRAIPFPTDKFDIVINRHESFDGGEVSRVLKSGGYFITQQVGGRNNNDLSRRLINKFKPRFADHDLENNIKDLKEKGFQIIMGREEYPSIKFFDTGALVYFAKIIEWEFPGFSVASSFENLCLIEREIAEKGYVQGTEHRFILVARNQK